MYKSNTLFKRLEAVVARLEDIAESLETSLVSSPDDVARSKAISQACAALGQVQGVPVPEENASGNLPEPIQEFDNFLKTTVDHYVKLSKGLGGPVANQAAAVRTCFHEQFNLLVASTHVSKPDATTWQEMTRPLELAAALVVEIQDTHRFDPMHSHLTCVADGIPVVGWINIEMRAFHHVDKFLDYARYFGNKVTQEYKDADPKHLEWVESYYQIFRQLSELLKNHFAMGIQWGFPAKKA